MVNWEFEKRSLYVFSFSDLPIKLIIFSMIGLLGVGTVAGRLTNQPDNSVIQPQEKLTNFATVAVTIYVRSHSNNKMTQTPRRTSTGIELAYQKGYSQAMEDYALTNFLETLKQTYSILTESESSLIAALLIKQSLQAINFELVSNYLHSIRTAYLVDAGVWLLGINVSNHKKNLFFLQSNSDRFC